MTDRPVPAASAQYPIKSDTSDPKEVIDRAQETIFEKLAKLPERPWPMTEHEKNVLREVRANPEWDEWPLPFSEPK